MHSCMLQPMKEANFLRRSSKPSLTDLLGDNYSFIWLQKDSDKLYLQSGKGGNAIQILSEKQFGRDTTFRKNFKEHIKQKLQNFKITTLIKKNFQ